MMRLLLLVLFGFGTCELELMQSGVDVNDWLQEMDKRHRVVSNAMREDVDALLDAGLDTGTVAELMNQRYHMKIGDAVDLVEKLHGGAEAALEVGDVTGASWGWGQRRRAPTGVAFNTCKMLFPLDVADVVKFNAGMCTSGSSCEIRGKAIGATWDMDGQVGFGCATCLCPPESGSITATKYFNIVDKWIPLGILGKKRVKAGGHLTITVGIADDGGGGRIRITVSMGGGVDVRVDTIAASASIHGSVTLGNICLGGGCGSLTLHASVYMKFSVTLGELRFELKITILNTKKWDVENMSGPGSDAPGDVSQIVF